MMYKLGLKFGGN